MAVQYAGSILTLIFQFFPQTGSHQDELMLMKHRHYVMPTLLYCWLTNVVRRDEEKIIWLMDDRLEDYRFTMMITFLRKRVTFMRHRSTSSVDVLLLKMICQHKNVIDLTFKHVNTTFSIFHSFSISSFQCLKIRRTNEQTFIEGKKTSHVVFCSERLCLCLCLSNRINLRWPSDALRQSVCVPVYQPCYRCPRVLLCFGEHILCSQGHTRALRHPIDLWCW